MCEHRACMRMCVGYRVTANMWGTEGGRCNDVNENHQSQWSSAAQQESLPLVYTCWYTCTRTRARRLGNQGGCCCFKASQRVHKLINIHVHEPGFLLYLCRVRVQEWERQRERVRKTGKKEGKRGEEGAQSGKQRGNDGSDSEGEILGN